MTNKWFGPFDTYLFTADSQNVLGWTEQPQYFNRPDGCTAQQVGQDEAALLGPWGGASGAIKTVT